MEKKNERIINIIIFLSTLFFFGGEGNEIIPSWKPRSRNSPNNEREFLLTHT